MGWFLTYIFGEIISSLPPLVIRDENRLKSKTKRDICFSGLGYATEYCVFALCNRIQHLHMFLGFHGLLTNVYCSECLDFQVRKILVSFDIVLSVTLSSCFYFAMYFCLIHENLISYIICICYMHAFLIIFCQEPHFCFN